MTKPDSKWLEEFTESVNGPARRGDYKSALVVARRGFRQFPDEFKCQYLYAKILGDYADELPAARRKKFKSESVSLLRPLLRRLNGQPVTLRYGICVNYYYQTEDFHGMYRYGRRLAKQDRRLGDYAQGLAAALIAHDLYLKEKSAASRTWARKGAQAWTRYNLSKEPYYFAHYSAAKAYALAGDIAQARKSLKRAAVLGKRPITDWEFADVLKLITS